MNRRNFIKSGCALSAYSAMPVLAKLPSKKILVLGGTGYFGPVLVNELIRHGYQVTLFNRGITNPHLFPELEKLRGDRETLSGAGLTALKQSKKQWDWVVDTWQGSSKCVADTAKILEQKTSQYQYVSTVSVYDKWDKVGITEDEALNPLPAANEPMISPNRYAIRKTFSEGVLNEIMPGRSTFFRSHGMRGYPTNAPRHEPYWQVKIQRAKELVLPSDIQHYQVTDMLSLARFMIRSGERRLFGAYNVCYPPMLFRNFIQNIVDHTQSLVKLHWIPQEFLLKQNVKLMREQPAGRYRFDVSKAIIAGLVNRPISALTDDQLRGYFDRNPNDDFEFGKPETATISSEKEQQIIRLWKQHAGSIS